MRPLLAPLRISFCNNPFFPCSPNLGLGGVKQGSVSVKAYGMQSCYSTKYVFGYSVAARAFEKSVLAPGLRRSRFPWTTLWSWQPSVEDPKFVNRETAKHCKASTTAGAGAGVTAASSFTSTCKLLTQTIPVTVHVGKHPIPHLVICLREGDSMTAWFSPSFGTEIRGIMPHAGIAWLLGYPRPGLASGTPDSSRTIIISSPSWRYLEC